MLRIRFNRRGKKNQPFFRIVVVERHKDPFGDYLEDLGYYNPLTKEAKFKKDRIKHWLSNGAQATGSVHNLFVSEGVIEGEKVKVSKYRKKEEAKEEAKEEKKEEAKEEAKEEVKDEETKEETKDEKKEEAKDDTKETKDEKKEEAKDEKEEAKEEVKVEKE